MNKKINPRLERRLTSHAIRFSLEDITSKQRKIDRTALTLSKRYFTRRRKLKGNRRKKALLAFNHYKKNKEDALNVKEGILRFAKDYREFEDTVNTENLRKRCDKGAYNLIHSVFPICSGMRAIINLRRLYDQLKTSDEPIYLTNKAYERYIPGLGSANH